MAEDCGVCVSRSGELTAAVQGAVWRDLARCEKASGLVWDWWRCCTVRDTKRLPERAIAFGCLLVLLATLALLCSTVPYGRKFRRKIKVSSEW